MTHRETLNPVEAAAAGKSAVEGMYSQVFYDLLKDAAAGRNAGVDGDILLQMLISRIAEMYIAACAAAGVMADRSLVETPISRPEGTNSRG